MKYRGVIWMVPMTLLVFFCTSPPPLDSIIVEDYVDKLTNNSLAFKIKGGGAVEAAAYGSRYSGSADVIDLVDSFFSLGVYSPFGSTVAGIKCDSTECSATTPETTVQFNRDAKISDLRLGLTADISFEQFSQLITSRFTLFSELFKQLPVDTSSNKSYFIFTWKDSLSELTLEINRINGQINKIKCKPNIYDTLIIYFNDFTGSFARRIRFFNDDRNYFQIEYDKLITLFN